MARLGDAVLHIGADLTDLNSKLGQVKKGVGSTMGNVQKLGAGISASITAPFALMATQGVNAFREQQKAIAQVEAGLKSTGNQVGFTSQQLQNMASGLQGQTLFGDEEILKDATAQLLTFTNITGKEFERTQQTALDLATRLDGDLKSSSILLGKALNDPVANLSALGRAGIQFSDEQKEVIKSMAETGDLAGAQSLILDELNKQYGGSAQAAAQADGGFTQLANSFGDLQEEIGEVVVNALQPLIKFARNIIDGFMGMSDTAKTLTVGFGAVAAAIGPILLFLPQLVSVASIAGPALGAAFTAMTGPIGIAIAALAALTAAFFYFWDEIKVPLRKAINLVIDFYNENEGIRIAIALLKQQFINTFSIAKRMVMNVVDSFALLFSAIKTAITDGFGAGFDVLKQGMKDIADKTVQTGKDVYNSYADAVANAKKKKPIEFVTDEDLDAAMDRVKGFFTFDLGGDAGSESMDKVGDSAKKTIKPLEQTTTVLEKMDKTLQSVGSSVADGVAPISRLREEFVQVIDMGEITQSAFIGIGEAISGLASGATTGSQILGQAFTTLGNFLKKIGSAMVGQAVAMREFQKSLITNPIKATAMGVAFVASGALLANYGQQLTEGVALAKGGLAFGETLAVVGDNPGASFDPEVIAPLSKLKDMMGAFMQGSITDNLSTINEQLATLTTEPNNTRQPDVSSSLMNLNKSMQSQAVEVYGRISGSDILLSNARAERDRNRTF